MVAFLLSILIVAFIVVVFAFSLKAVYIHYGDQKRIVYSWLSKIPEIKCSGNSYKERKGKDIHVYCRDSSARIRVGESMTVYINRGKICVLD